MEGDKMKRDLNMRRLKRRDNWTGKGRGLRYRFRNHGLEIIFSDDLGNGHRGFVYRYNKVFIYVMMKGTEHTEEP